MIKLSYKSTFFLLLPVIALILWFASGPQITARVAHAKYRQPTFEYRVRIHETLHDGKLESGILVDIVPDSSAEKAEKFSADYVKASHGRIARWEKEGRANRNIDATIVFAHPLTLEEANTILNQAKASVYESAAVGYVDGDPFAHHNVESGPLLAKTLEQIAEMDPTSRKEAETGQKDLNKVIDIRGYMGVRVWVPAQEAKQLLKNPNIALVDTTPQEVRDLLANDLNWKNSPIDSSLGVEIPVWAYSWDK